MKLKVSVKNSALILADIIIYCPGYRLASAPNMNQANSQLGKQTKKDMSAGGSAETQRIKPILAAVRQAEQIRDKPHSISQKRYLVLRFKSYGVLTNKIEHMDFQYTRESREGARTTSKTTEEARGAQLLRKDAWIWTDARPPPRAAAARWRPLRLGW